jgi:hypothetical protein
VSWQRRAACAGEINGDWYASEITLDCATTCFVCPVRIDCYSEAIIRQRDGDVGVWGGTTLAQRERIRSGRATLNDVWRELEELVREAHVG